MFKTSPKLPPLPRILPSEYANARVAARHVVTIHERLAKFMKSGMTLGQIDSFVGKTLDELGASSCFLGYQIPRMPKFPSHACLSVNECVVHGTAASLDRPLGEGDILTVDIGVLYRGWIGDAAWTYSFGQPPEMVRRLMDVGIESLKRGVLQMKPGVKLLEFARAVQGYVEGQEGFYLVRGLGGHGIGRTLHGPPFVSNVVPETKGEWPECMQVWEPGVLVAVEPMLAAGTSQTIQKSRSWPVLTADGSPSVHYEHDVLITENGPEVLTKDLEALVDVLE